MLHARRAKRLLATALATLALVALPTAALAKIDTTASTCAISSGSASVTVVWKGRDPNNVTLQYDDVDGQQNPNYVPSAGELTANAFTQPLATVPINGVTIRFQTSGNKAFDQASVACTGA